MTTEEENLQVVRDLTEAYNNNDVDGILSHYAEDVVYVGPSGTRHEKQATRDVITGFKAAFRDSRRIDRMIAQGNTVVLESTWEGTHKGEYLGIPATHKTITLPFVDILDFESGKIIVTKLYTNIRRLEQALRAK
jgi:steroid delta-isomerase-like uncharacterized protein